MIRFLSSLFVILGLTLIPSLSCTSQPSQAPATTPTPTTTPAQAPVITAPVPSSPSNTSTTQGITVKLEWQPATGATSYGLQISTDSAFTKPIIEKSGITGTYYELTSGLNRKTGYYWRVNASNASSTSSWSEQWKFITPVLQLNKIAFTSFLRDGNPEIYVMNADGSNQTRLTNNPAFDVWPSWSPDGTKIAFHSERDGKPEIYVMNADGSNQTRLTNNPGSDNSAAWSPDGTKIAFGSNRTDNWEIYVMNADGSNQTRITNDNKWDWIPAWSPDGTKIAYTHGIAAGSQADVYIMNIDGSNQTNLTYNPANIAEDAFSTWSPDGTKIAFHSNRDGNYEIYVMNVNGSNQTRLTNSPAEDSQSSWR